MFSILQTNIHTPLLRILQILSSTFLTLITLFISDTMYVVSWNSSRIQYEGKRHQREA